MTAPARIPLGSWPYQLDAAGAAGFVGEKSVEAFRRKLGTVYPKPTRIAGLGDRWLRKDLESALDNLHGRAPVDGGDLL
ncbi:MAG: hypothetical protein AAFR79_07535 [Pseudomonadota bacterium]